MARAHQLGGRGVLPRRRSVPMEGLKGRAVANGLGPPVEATGSPAQAAVRAHGGLAADSISQWPATDAEGTGSPGQAAVGAYGGPAGHGSLQPPGPTIWVDRESCPSGGWCP